jgi:hypothetical protein
MVDATTLELFLRGGALAVLLWVVVGFMRGWIVPGSVHQAVAKEKEEWKALAVDLLQTARDAVRVAGKE